jgi:hypothetical protein
MCFKSVTALVAAGISSYLLNPVNVGAIAALLVDLDDTDTISNCFHFRSIRPNFQSLSLMIYSI